MIITEYTPEEFERALYARGACTRKTAKEEKERLGKDSYTEDDVIEVYRKYHGEKLGAKDYGHSCDPERMPNSSPSKDWQLRGIMEGWWK